MQHSCKYAHILTVLLKAKKYILQSVFINFVNTNL